MVIATSVWTGRLAQTHTYSPYGLPDEFGVVAGGNPYLYTGREYDSETGLYYYRNRYYDPQRGRFLQPDPIGYKAGMNLYAYVDGNPITWADPLGLDKMFQSGAGSHINPMSIVGSLNAGLGAGLEVGLPFVAFDLDVFAGKTLNLDPYAGKDGNLYERTEGGRATLTVNVSSFEMTGGVTYDAKTGETDFLNPFTNGLSTRAEVPMTFKIKPKLVIGLGGKIGVEIDLRSCINTPEGC